MFIRNENDEIVNMDYVVVVRNEGNCIKLFTDTNVIEFKANDPYEIECLENNEDKVMHMTYSRWVLCGRSMIRADKIKTITHDDTNIIFDLNGLTHTVHYSDDDELFELMYDVRSSIQRRISSDPYTYLEDMHG